MKNHFPHLKPAPVKYLKCPRYSQIAKIECLNILYLGFTLEFTLCKR